ncbi:hypothetical protein [Paenibacillus ginsengarvi]|uniref:hypothetical protein n=1 Tax=Paenibacillus ginsengarvi TaxID=400777 RepID=UPI001315ACD8|nr:hypothetical protein [Paenibacillus ginsengarvi]
MVQKEKMVTLFDKLNASDQKKAYEYIQTLAHRNRDRINDEGVSKLYGKKYYVVSD